MILVALQCALLIAAGYALFRLWRVAAPAARWLYLVTAAGFLGRAILGQALFWISWASLPFGRSLQLGNGLWIFASDATFYIPVATSAAEHGWRAILFLDRGTASVTYLQLLASMVKLFGSPVSIALLLNLFCYLGTIAILVRWSVRQPQTRIPVAVAITALSLSPAFVLWSLQPLKDSLFQLLFVAFVAACAAWQRAWNAQSGWTLRIATGALLAVLLFCIAGIRWYFAAVLIAATALFMSGVVMQSAARKSMSIAAVVMMIVVLSLTLVISAAPYLPPSVASTLTPRMVLTVLDQTRRGFDQTAASTMIQPGARLKTIAETPKPVVAAPKPVVAAPKPVVVAPKPVVVASVLPAQAPAPKVLPAPAPPAPPPVVVKRVLPAPVVRKTQPVPTAAPSRIERFLAGSAVLVLPRVIGERFGLFHIGGGRGFLWFADIDTFAFDVILLFALLVLASRSRTTWRNPLTWLVLAITLLIFGPLAYSISNFGTLFRLREMIYIGLLLIPLAAATRAQSTADDQSEPQRVR
jgi:hypothetical protein